MVHDILEKGQIVVLTDQTGLPERVLNGSHTGIVENHIAVPEKNDFRRSGGTAEMFVFRIRHDRIRRTGGKGTGKDPADPKRKRISDTGWRKMTDHQFWTVNQSTYNLGILRSLEKRFIMQSLHFPDNRKNG